MATNKLITAAVRSALFVSAIAAAGLPAAALAQQAAQQTELEEIIVTGSLIPVDLNAPGIPVTLVTAADIAATGSGGDLLDVLKKSQPFFYGGLNIGSENGNISSGSTNGGSQVSLRNRATLVLINGRRVAVSPVAASGGNAFSDVSLVPVSAVERIEVLADGASATYGSDAVGGVINIILKSNFDGVEVGGRYGLDDGGQWGESSYYGTIGASNDTTRITFSTEYKQQDPMLQKDRSWADACCTPSFAGSVNIRGTTTFYWMNPNINAPPGILSLTPAQLVAAGIYSGPYTQAQMGDFFDLTQKPTMLIDAERRAAVLSFEHDFNDQFTLFGDYIYSQSETWSRLNAQPVNTNVGPTNANSPFSIEMTVRNRLVDFPRTYETDTYAQRGVIGLRGDIAGSWKFELAGNFNKTDQKYQNDGVIDAALYNIASALPPTNPLAFNPFARVQRPGVIESFVGTEYGDYESSLNGYDARAWGDVFQLPAGAMQLAVGLDGRTETLAYNNDLNTRNGTWLGATPTDPFDAETSSQGYFAELRVPITSPDFNLPGLYAMEMSLAGRKEMYDQTTDPFVPKFTLRWQPFGETFAVRGTYSESFVAPTLYELFGPSAVGFTPGTVINRYDTSGKPLNVKTGSSQFRSKGGSNEDLDPSESRNWTAGMVWTPQGALEGLEVALDWFDISEEDIINSVDSELILQSVEELGPNSPYASLVRLGQSERGELRFEDGAPVTTPGQMSNRPSDEVWVTSTNVNLSGVDQSGLDMRVAYARDTDWGMFSGQVAATWLNEYIESILPSEPPSDLVGTFDGDALYPDWRAFLQLGWDYKGFTVGLNGTFIPSVDDTGFDEPFYKVDSYQAYDLRVGYDFSQLNEKNGLKVTLGINNFTDEDPVYIPSEGDQSAEIGDYDPIGRYYYVEASYKF